MTRRLLGGQPPAVPVACAGFFMVVLDTTVVTIALPSIERDLGGGVSGLQWVVDGYTLLFGALLLVAGGLSDRLGARRCFAWGMGLFALSSAACGVAPSLEILIVARGLQGAAAALMLPSSLALVGQAHTDPREQAKAIGLWTAAGSAAIAAGPVIGGLLTEWPGWRAVFFVNVPVAAAALVALVRVAPSPGHTVRFDLAGHVLAVLAVAALTFGLIEGGERGFGSPTVVAACAAAVLLGLLFVVVERRTAAPAVPLRLLANRPAIGTLGVGAALYFSFYGLVFTLSLVFQQVRGEGPVATGLLFLPMTLVIVGMTIWAIAWTRRFGAWVPMASGVTLMAIGLTLLAALGAHAAGWPIALSIAVAGAGAGLAGPAIVVALVSALPRSQAGVASGMANALRQVAATVGVAVFGAFMVGRDDVAAGARLSFIVAAAAMAGALVLAVTCVRPWRNPRAGGRAASAVGVSGP